MPEEVVTPVIEYVTEYIEPDLTPVLVSIDGLQQSMNDTLAAMEQLTVSLEQLHTDTSLMFLGIVLLIGVVLGCAMGFMFVRMWGT